MYVSQASKKVKHVCKSSKQEGKTCM